MTMMRMMFATLVTTSTIIITVYHRHDAHALTCSLLIHSRRL
jgi:hypothetical protein